MSSDLPSRDPGLPRFAVLVAVLALLGAGASALGALAPGLISPEGAQPGGVSDLDTASGASLFVAEGCGTCHVTVGPSTVLYPSLAGIGQTAAQRINAEDYDGAAESPEEYVREAVLDHCAYVVPGYSCEEAPDVGVRLGQQQVQALVDFLLQLD